MQLVMILMNKFDEGVPPIPDFQQPTGPSVHMTDKSPLDFFELMVTDDMLDHIVKQTKPTSMLNNTLTQPPSLHSLAYTAGIEVHN